MKHRLLMGLMAGAMIAHAGGVGHATAMKTVDIVDPFFRQRAFTITVPADWKLEGTLLRGTSGAEAPELVFRASSPDGLKGVQQLPRYTWSWSNDQGMLRRFKANHQQVMPPLPAGDFLKKVVIPAARRGAKVGVVAPLADNVGEKLVEQDRKTNEQLAATTPRGMVPNRLKSDSARVRIEYDLDGHAVEEWLVTITSSMETTSSLVGVPKIHTLTSEATVRGVRAPKGQLDASEPSLRAIALSVTADPAWMQKQGAFASQQDAAQRERRVRQSNAEQAAILSRSRQNLDAIHRQGAAILRSERASEDARHAGAVGTSQHMGDRETYVDPTTGRRGELSNQHAHSYANESGETIQTDSPTFDPNAQLRGNWTQLQPVKGP